MPSYTPNQSHEVDRHFPLFSLGRLFFNSIKQQLFSLSCDVCCRSVTCVGNHGRVDVGRRDPFAGGDQSEEQNPSVFWRDPPSQKGLGPSWRTTARPTFRAQISLWTWTWINQMETCAERSMAASHLLVHEHRRKTVVI